MENKQSKSIKPTSSAFSRASAWLFSQLKNGIFGHFFTSYDSSNEKFKNRIKKNQNVNEKRTKRTIARAIEKSPLVSIGPRVYNFLLRVSVRDFGIVLLTMSIFTLAMFFAEDYVSIIHSSTTSLITGIVLAFFSLIMLISKKPIAKVVFEGRLSNLLLFQFLGIRDDDYRDASDDAPHSSMSISLLSGLILSIISYFITPLWTLIIIGIAFLAYQVLITPESGILVIILSLAFTSTIIMSVISAYVVVCYIVKCVIGKRTFKFELIDFYVSLMAIVAIWGGLMSKSIGSSVKEMILIIALMSSFFFFGNLVRSKEWYKRCLISICISSTITSILAIVQFVLGKIGITWSGSKVFSTIHTTAMATFKDADSLAIFLVACSPFLLLFVFSGQSAVARVVGIFCSAINTTALILTYSKAGYIGAIAMLVLLLLIFHRNTIYLVLVGIIAGVVINFALPVEILDMLSEIVANDANTHSYRILLFDSAIELIKENPLGVGVGYKAFLLALGSIDTPVTFTDCGNLYLQIAVSCGIVALVVFAVALICFFRLCLSYCAKSPNRFHRINALAGFVGVFGILVSGFYTYCWRDRTIFYMFCICAALTLAYIRIERDSYGVYFKQSIDYLSASVDIDLDKESVRESVPIRKYVRTPKRKRTSSRHNALDGIKDNEIDPIIHGD